MNIDQINSKLNKQLLSKILTFYSHISNEMIHEIKTFKFEIINKKIYEKKVLNKISYININVNVNFSYFVEQIKEMYKQPGNMLILDQYAFKHRLEHYYSNQIIPVHLTDMSYQLYIISIFNIYI